MAKVRYEIEVDKEMFPSAPGSEVVVRDLPRMNQGELKWEKVMFMCKDSGYYTCRVKENDDYYVGGFKFCYSFTTHGHLLGTTYQADTPACAKCGKAQPDCVCEKVNKWHERVKKTMSEAFDARGVNQQNKYEHSKAYAIEPEADQCHYCEDVSKQYLTFPTADGVDVKKGNVVWHHGHGRGIAGHSRTIFDDNHSLYLSDCSSKPCTRLADGSVAMVGDSVKLPMWGCGKPTFDGKFLWAEFSHAKIDAVSVCWPLGNLFHTPKEMYTITVERDRLLAELEAVKGTNQPQQTTTHKCEECNHRTDDIYGHCDDCPSRDKGEYQGEFCCSGEVWFRFVIPYEGHEHLLTTPNSHEGK